VGGSAEAVRVALLTYRGNPRSGGQGVYTRHISRALVRLGHDVEVFSGPPYPDLDPCVRLTRLPSLDLYRPEAPFRPARRPRSAVDVLELGTMCVGGFPEPLTFSLRAWAALRQRRAEFDVVHDNQCLAYGILGIRREGLPVLASIHHPIQIDRKLELAHATGGRRLSLRRWYGFTRMQARVARRLPIVTVSTSSRTDIEREMGVPAGQISLVPLGVDTEVFRPLPDRRRVPGRILVTTSADVPLKGLAPLLRAFAVLRARRPAELVIVGSPRPDGPIPGLLDELALNGSVRFTGAVADAELVALYAEAEAAVVPSLYEGFSLPAIEAMACGLPLVATTGGALPEVVGDSGLLVPPGDPQALADQLTALLADPGLRLSLGERGRRRVASRFTWVATARATVERYREVMGC
jgi:glycosyltransferase involved in cell wall biosynthesis